ncbi:MAG: amidohydrolase [Rhodoglobus sp.]
MTPANSKPNARRSPPQHPPPTVYVTIDAYWQGHWHGPATVQVTASDISVLTDAARDAAMAAAAETGVPIITKHLPGALLPGFRDAHVHLGLIEPHTLIAGGLAAVDDLGGDPQRLSRWANDHTVPAVRYAGAFITAPGGYPSDRRWAKDLAICEVATTEHIVAAVAQQVAAGASMIKVALNADDGPVLSDVHLTTLVKYAHECGREVVAHAQGAGQALRAFTAGVDTLAHTPWTQRLDDDLIRRMAQPDSRFLAGRHSWISTLDIHGYGSGGLDAEVASDNLARFHQAGGRILYGTDMGNGDLACGLNLRELTALHRAGVRDDALLHALCLPTFGTAVSHLPTVPTLPTAPTLTTAPALPDYLMTAHVLTAPDLMRIR